MSNLHPVTTEPCELTAYQDFVDPEMVNQIHALASELEGLKVVHINATPQGGGVAEILRSLVPLSRDVGLDARWFTLPPDTDFFGTTKQIHNCLQGQPGDPAPSYQDVYRDYLEALAEQLHGVDADVWVIHDPQPLALRTLVPLEGSTIWRCHIDCSTPNADVRDFVLTWVRAFDRAVFSMPAYVMPGLAPDQIRISQPCIDPLTPKNQPMSTQSAHAMLARLGIDPDRPLVTQISRFDSWKNPWEAVDIYRMAKRHVPDLQLSIAGVFAAEDDPEAPRVFAAVRDYAGNDPDVHLLTNPEHVGPLQINALQSTSDVILQRSTREGFGLTVTEAMWKGRPVIATRVGGIPGQIEHGRTGFLTATADDSAQLLVQLLQSPMLAQRIGRAARAEVQQRFLLPRLALDELQLYGDLVGGQLASRRAA